MQTQHLIKSANSSKQCLRITSCRNELEKSFENGPGEPKGGDSSPTNEHKPGDSKQPKSSKKEYTKKANIQTGIMPLFNLQNPRAAKPIRSQALIAQQCLTHFPPLSHPHLCTPSMTTLRFLKPLPLNRFLCAKIQIYLPPK